MNAIADNAPQTPKNAPSARLTCVMCGGDNALDATQCEHCGAALQPAIVAAPPRAASTRAATETVAPQPIERAATTLTASQKIVIAPADETVKSTPPTQSSAPNASAVRPAATKSDVARATTPPATKSVSVTFDFTPLDAPSGGDDPDSATANSATSQQAKNVDGLQKPVVALPPEIASTRSSAAIPAKRGEEASEEVRAQNLLDRAFRLAEIGDLDAAILACSEAAMLQPKSAAPPSMLALLLERSGDTASAIQAYRRALKIAPDNRAAQGSLTRLQAATQLPDEKIAPPGDAPREYSQAGDGARNAGSATVSPAPLKTKSGALAASDGNFVVTPDDSSAASGATAKTKAPTTESSAVASASVFAPAASPTFNRVAADASAAKSAADDAKAASGATAIPGSDAMRASTRSGDLESATQNDISALSQFLQDISAPDATATTAADATSAKVSIPSAARSEPAAPAAAWRDSYFLRSLPLAAMALLGIWFLASSRPAASTRIVAPVATPTASATPLAAATEAASPQNLSVEEQLAAAVAAAQAAPKPIVPTATPVNNIAPALTATPLATPTVSATPFPPPILPPATTGATAPTATGAVPNLPPQNAAPAGDSSNFERGAQLQQRALAALEAGANAAAARGFGNAIEAYNAQIATGFRADEARAAAAACRDGIQLAQQMQNRAAQPR